MHVKKTIGQGATEYLVLLAVVLIIALVAIALLGFFPGTAGDVQLSQSKSYWSSAQPVSVVEGAARLYPDYGTNRVYLRLRNSGAYPIRITRLISGSDDATQFLNDSWGAEDISKYFYMAPGEEKYFGYYGFGPLSGRYITIAPVGVFTGGTVGMNNAAQQSCRNLTTGGFYGYLSVKNFDIEYVQYVEGQQIAKKQVGSKPLVLPCLSAG